MKELVPLPTNLYQQILYKCIQAKIINIGQIQPKILTKQSCDAVANNPSWNGENRKSVTVSVCPCNSGIFLLLRPQSSSGNTAKLDPVCSQGNAMKAAEAAILLPYVWYDPTLCEWKCGFDIFDEEMELARILSAMIHNLWRTTKWTKIKCWLTKHHGCRFLVSVQLEPHSYTSMPWIAKPFCRSN